MPPRLAITLLILWARVPDARLLTNGLKDWLVSIAEVEAEPSARPIGRIALSLHQPDSSKPTVRFCDPEFFYVAVLHVIHGGRFFIHPNGNKKNYYWRINLYGADGNKRLRPYALRLIVDTRMGTYTKEAGENAEDKYHDLTRAALGKLFVPRSANDRASKYERGDAIKWSVAHFVERPGWHFCATADEYHDLLIDGYKWLDRVPLGQADDANSGERPRTAAA